MNFPFNLLPIPYRIVSTVFYPFPSLIKVKISKNFTLIAMTALPSNDTLL